MKKKLDFDTNNDPDYEPDDSESDKRSEEERSVVVVPESPVVEPHQHCEVENCDGETWVAYHKCLMLLCFPHDSASLPCAHGHKEKARRSRIGSYKWKAVTQPASGNR